MIVVEKMADVLVVDSRLIAERLGIAHKNFLAMIDKYNPKMAESARIKAAAFYDRLVKRPQGGTFKERWALLTESQAKAIIYRSRSGLSHEDVTMFQTMGFDFSECLRPKRTCAKRSEADYRNALWRELGGSREVPTEAGNIDLLTSTELIEVKFVKSWKAALGQVLVYGDYYPSHRKRLHLFGGAHDSILKIIESHCFRREVTLTWEP